MNFIAIALNFKLHIHALVGNIGWDADGLRIAILESFSGEHCKPRYQWMYDVCTLVHCAVNVNTWMYT